LVSHVVCGGNKYGKQEAAGRVKDNPPCLENQNM
jgi:hypothetical protein